MRQSETGTRVQQAWFFMVCTRDWFARESRVIEKVSRRQEAGPSQQGCHTTSHHVTPRHTTSSNIARFARAVPFSSNPEESKRTVTCPTLARSTLVMMASSYLHVCVVWFDRHNWSALYGLIGTTGQHCVA